MPKEYIVKNGDGLEKIAKGYPDVSAEDIVAANKEVDNYYSTIHPGQVLIIPTEEKVEDKNEPDNNNYKKYLYKDNYEYYEAKIDNTFVKKPIVLCPNEIEKYKRLVSKKIRISLFFDGTGNNRANTNSRIKHKDILENKKSNDYVKAVAAGVLLSPIESLRYACRTYDSYDNDFSNISRLEQYTGNHPSYDFSKSIYIEGIGTTNLKADNTRGMITGRNSIYATSSGIRAKTKKGLKGAIKLIDSLCSSEKEKIKLEIDLDVFGFSRGAAAARYFVYLVLNSNSTLSDQLREKGYWVSSVNIKFVGLFDTVSSYGGLINSDRSLHLGFTKANMPEKVVQLAAAEEYRNSFPLTNIDSAGEKGIEIFLPGCHSDIGGGYNDNEKEGYNDKGEKVGHQLLDLNLFNFDFQWLRDDMKQLIALGWYKKEEFEKEFDLVYKELKASRVIAYKSYSYIPLQLMADYALKSGVPIKKQGLCNEYKIPDEGVLADLKKEIDKHIAKYGRNSSYLHWHNNDAKILVNARHDYFHFSARFGDSGGAQAPRIVGKRREREVK